MPLTLLLLILAFGQKPPVGLDAAAFMTGCWRGPDRGPVLEEIYTRPASNIMQGMSRYVANGSVVDYEFALLEATDAGIRLTPHPKGQPSASFALKESAPGRLVWENPAHDFPQRIMYSTPAKDSLVARIEGKTSSGDRAMEWRMVRVECPR